MCESEAAAARARRRKLQSDWQEIQQQLRARLALPLDRGIVACVRRLLHYSHKGYSAQVRFQLFAYNLYCSKPQIYKRLKLLLKLPDENYFQNYTLYLAPEFDKCILYFLSSKLTSLRPEVNHFVLCVDWHPLNRNVVYDAKRDVLLGLHNINGVVSNKTASQAYVIMLRNLCVDWVHPVAYAFRSVMITTSTQLITTWYNNVLSQLLEIGIQVEAIVTWPESTFAMTNSRSRSTAQTNGVYKLHDLRALIEEVRNCLIGNDFYYKESRISWHYIKLLYYQHNSDIELIPDIKEVHMLPSGYHSSRWSLTKDIFSTTVYTALSQLIASGELPHEARPTANFMKAMSELCDVADYGPRASDAIPVAQQIPPLQRAAEMFCNIHVRSGDVPPAIAQIRITLARMATLLQSLAKEGFETVYTSRLTNAPVDAFFRAVPRTAKPGRRLKPTASQVYRAFEKAFLRSLRRRTRWARREDLAEAASCGLLDVARVPADALPARRPPRLPRAVDHRGPLPRTPGALASFMLYNCMQVHSCPQLDKSLHPRRLLLYKTPGAKPSNGSPHLWDRLLDPPGLFLKLVDELDERLLKVLKPNLFRGPGAMAQAELEQQMARRMVRALPCACFPRRLLLALLVRRRLWHSLRQTNQALRRGNNWTVIRLEKRETPLDRKNEN